MKINSKKWFLFGVLVVFQINCFGQENWLNDRLKEIKVEKLLYVYLDTLTSDTLFANYEIGQRILKSKENVELSRGSVYGGLGTKCGCTPVPHGLWVKRHRNGYMKEAGEYFCNRKVGTWTYYHGNGNLKKVETYELPYLEFLTEQGEPWDTLKNKEYLINGLYAEFYENGNLKIEGRYEIIEEFSNIDTLITFELETYNEIKTPITGAFWIPKSVKVGLWKEIDENGKLLKVENIEPVLFSEKRYRPIASRYYELFFSDKK